MKKFLVVSVIALACVSCGHIAPVSKYPNMVADLDPYSIGMARVSFDRFFSSDVKENEVDGVILAVIFVLLLIGTIMGIPA